MIRCPVCRAGMIPKDRYRRDRKMKCRRCGYVYNPRIPDVAWSNGVYF
jgi:DNA-directed RNA polymerase subunit M/transcription elongation factor TFIIS